MCLFGLILYLLINMFVEIQTNGKKPYSEYIYNYTYNYNNDV